MSGGNMKRRSKNPNGSETELTREDGMEMYGRSRPESAASGRRAWLDDGPGQDDVDYSPRNMTAADAHSMGGQTPMGGTKVASDQRAYQTNAPPPGISKKIQRGLRSLWKTRLTEDTDDDPELYVKTTLRELGIYVAFVVVLCIMTFGMTNSTMYYFTKVMKDLFVNKPGYDGLTTLKDFFSYTEGALMDGLYWENYYNGKVVPKDQQGYIYYENKLLGRPRLRQLRVRSNSCVVHDDFKREIKSCYGPYTADNEEKKTYGLENGTAWNYKTAKDLNGRSFWGRMATYQGGGYTQLLGNNSAESKDILAKLKKNLWVDRGTRAVMIDFTVYNANINLFCIVTLVLEYPLMAAAQGGHTSVCRTLLEAGADPDVPQAETGKPALVLAAGAGHLEACGALLDGRADPNAQALTGAAAIHAAAANGKEAVCNRLLASGANAALPGPCNLNAASLAASAGHEILATSLRAAAAAGYIATTAAAV